MDRKKGIILLSIVAVAALMSSFAYAAYATENNGDENTLMPKLRRWARAWGPGGGYFGFVEVSEEFKNNVINIAENDPDVQQELLSEGYTVTGVKPIIKSVVDGNGDVTTKATDAIVVYKNEDTQSHAAVWVNLDEARVTKIVILTKTIIDKT